MSAAEKLRKKITELELTVRRQEWMGTYWIAMRTLKILRFCVKKSTTSEDVEKNLLHVTERLIHSFDYTFVVSNCCQRVIEILNEEIQNEAEAKSSFKKKKFTDNVKRSKSLSLLEILVSQEKDNVNLADSNEGSLKNNVLAGIDELINEIPNTYEDISSFSLDFVNQGDIILVVGYANSVFYFLKKASQSHRKFTVIVTEHAPFYDGIKMANRLRDEAKINTIVIPDSCAFSVMPRVSTVFTSCRALYADGSFITTSFMKSVALAARHHSKPLIVLYSRFKLADRFIKPNESFTILSSPSSISTPFDKETGKATVLCPNGEVVNVQMATLFINEEGPHSPSDTFMQVQSLYHPND